MVCDEKELLRYLRKYAYNSKCLADAQDQLIHRTYSITPSYNSIGGGRANGNRSKVEDYVEKAEKLKREIAEYRRQLDIAEMALRCPELTTTEERTLWWIASGLRLATFSEMEGIYISTVYKIRDKAIRKAIKYLETQSVAKHG